MKADKSLQKFTESEAKINKVLELKQITVNDYKEFNEGERNRLFEIISEKVNKLKSEERDEFFKKIELITSESTKNQLWEFNHIEITNEITRFIDLHGRMPSKSEIATKTDLSRQTVYNHFKEYMTHPQYLGQIEHFRFMSSKLLAKVLQFAIRGDIGAAKLYFNVVGFINNEQTPNNTLIQNQNNYIQINGTVLSQETIKQLNPEQLTTIENILKTALPQTKVLEI